MNLDWLYKWQTLTGAVIALAAAVLTVCVMHVNTSRQLRAQAQADDESRKRRLRACRAVMPADLSAIVTYTEECGKVSAEMFNAVRDDTSRDPVVCPQLPERVVANLQMLIEQLDTVEADALADMLACYQVQHARLSSLVETYNHPHRFGRHTILTTDNVEFTFEQTVELHLRAAGAFDFARRRGDAIKTPPYTAKEVASTLANLEIADVLTTDYSAFLFRTYGPPDPAA